MPEADWSDYMDHEQSIKTQAAERYLLEELPPALREEFERHYFGCADCAEEVRLGFQFSRNLNAVFRDQAQAVDSRLRRSSRNGWLNWAPIAAGLAIAAFSGYQNVLEIPALRARTARFEAARVFSPVVLAPASRAEAPALAIPAGADLQFSLAPGPARSGGHYECQLRSAAGTVLWQLPIEVVDPEANLTLIMPTARLSAGRYEVLLLSGGGRDAHELDRYPFVLRLN
jgi:hypothetical protein